MKRFLLVFVFFLCICAFSAAEVDLSGMSYDELAALKNRINKAMWESEDFQSVIVPQGRWVVGEDIPEGKYTIFCAPVDKDDFMLSECDFSWSDSLDENGDLRFSSENKWDYMVVVYNSQHNDYKEGQFTGYTWDAKNGYIIEIANAHAPALFTSYAGKPTLKFK